MKMRRGVMEASVVTKTVSNLWDGMTLLSTKNPVQSVSRSVPDEEGSDVNARVSTSEEEKDDLDDHSDLCFLADHADHADHADPHRATVLARGSVSNPPETRLRSNETRGKNMQGRGIKIKSLNEAESWYHAKQS
jgi:hypothetical protein